MIFSRIERQWSLLAILASALLLPVLLWGEASCPPATISATPSRPTVSSSTDTTLCGVLELEYGWTRSWPGAGSVADALSSSFRFGLTRNLDLRWSDDNWLHSVSGDQHLQGTGDNSVGVRYRIHDQGHTSPALAVAYGVKFATAAPAKGFGSGFTDHSFALLASKDAGKLHFDFNAVETIVGDAHSHDVSQLYALALSVPVKGNLGFSVESYGGTQPGDVKYASVLTALTYRVRPRLVLDAALDNAVTSGVARRRVLVGLTYSIFGLRHPR